MELNHSFLQVDPSLKPTYGSVKIDWTNPMTRGLTGFYIFNEEAPGAVTNLVTPQEFTVGGTGTTLTKKGVKFDGNGWLYSTQTARSPYLLTRYPYTVIISAKNATDQLGYFFGVGTSSVSYYTMLAYSASLDKAAGYGRWNGTALTMLGPNNHWSSRVGYHTLAWVSNTQTDHYLYFDLAQIDSDTTDIGNTFTGVTYVMIGAAGTSGTNKVGANGELDWAMVFDGRALSLLEQKSLRDAPYQFLIPEWTSGYRWKTTAQPPSVGSSIFGGSVFSGPITIGPIVR